MPDPGRTLLEHIRFAGAASDRSECHADPARDTYLCSADYEFAAPVDRLEVECTFTAITVPNHVHLLRASLGDKRDEAIFDLGFTHATLRFRPPTATEIAVTQAGAGFVRALGGTVQVLFLAALVLAARSRRELLAIAPCFCWDRRPACWQWCMSSGSPRRASWRPRRRWRWPISPWRSCCSRRPVRAGWWRGYSARLNGLYFHLFVQTTRYSPALVLLGAALAELSADRFARAGAFAGGPHGESVPSGAGRRIGAASFSVWSGSCSACGASSCDYRRKPSRPASNSLPHIASVGKRIRCFRFLDRKGD